MISPEEVAEYVLKLLDLEFESGKVINIKHCEGSLDWRMTFEKKNAN